MHMFVCVNTCIDNSIFMLYNLILQVHICSSAEFHLPLCSVEYAAGSLSSELRGTGGEEEEQFLNHGANVGG